jgi:hypothetical protein
VCCTDSHFVNVHITRLEAVAMRETLIRTPRLTEVECRAVFQRARETVALYDLRASGDTFAQTYSCPLYDSNSGCLVHRRAKPAPCIQHACYENWEDLPPAQLEARTEHQVEQLNRQVYGNAWAWLPTPVWLCLIDPDSDGKELERLARVWNSKRNGSGTGNAERRRSRSRRSLPVRHAAAAR